MPRLTCYHRRVPNLGVQNLGKRVDFSQTRTAVPIAARQSVRCLPVMASPIGLASRYRTGQERPESRKALDHSMFPSAAPCADEDSPMMD